MALHYIRVRNAVQRYRIHGKSQIASFKFQRCNL